MKYISLPFIYKVILAVFCFQLETSLLAQWSSNPAVNTPISAAPVYQDYPTITSDGTGGAIITWEDRREGAGFVNIYAQRINNKGVVQWTTNGVAISTASGAQDKPVIIGDGAGGAIIAWNDKRSGSYDIYAQRIDSAGIVQWTTNGVAISAAAGVQREVALAGDDSGGAIITWKDNRGGTEDIYAQRINSAGAVQWTTDGVAISMAANIQDLPAITGDGSGGAIITWRDFRSNTAYDIYAQRVSSSGIVQWTTDGIAITIATNDQDAHAITGDNSGGAIITWMDKRSGSYDIYAQRIDSAGAVMWTTNGVAISTAGSGQVNPVITSDGTGGGIISWHDERSGSFDIYAQRISIAGAVQWTGNGVAISTATNIQTHSMITGDGSGGAIIAWEDQRNGGLDIYARRINSAGALQWTGNGVAISTASNDQWFHTLISDGSGGAIITWADWRPSTHSDIYAQRILAGGMLASNDPTITGVANPDTVQAGNSTILTGIVVAGTGPASTGLTVTGNLLSIGGSASQAFYDDGTHGDTTGGNGVFTFTAPVPSNTTAGVKNVTLIVSDEQERSDTASVNLVVLPYPCATITLMPASLPDDSVGHPYNDTVTASGGTPPYSYSVSAGSLPKGIILSPGGVVSGTLDSSGTFSFTVTATDSNGCTGEKPYMITISETEISLAVPVEASWNIVSNPLLVSNDSARVLFPASVGSAFMFSPADGYLTSAKMINGKGYWLKFSSAVTETITGASLLTDTIHVSAGWNIIGSISFPLAVTDIISIPPEMITSQFFGYALGYTSSDTIYPGKGYWVKTAFEGELILSSLPARTNAAGKISIINISELPPSPPDGELLQQGKQTPGLLLLNQNYPNPFNPTTVINYTLLVESHVVLKVFNLLGEEVETLVNEMQDAGFKSQAWDATGFASGMYYYRLQAGDFVDTKKLLLVK
ncbi:MAG: T9SS type A sorting domain-containing protein [Bacteroidetes bacterium]|nr:MAG: T9SS type A sorting domain-containing protein [Bacteroidota bacterium]